MTRFAFEFMYMIKIVSPREAKRGFGDEIPKQVWAAAQRNPYEKNVVSEQAAKQPTIETG